MNIGILAYRQDPYISANTAIAYAVGEEMNKIHHVVFIGRKQDLEQKDGNIYHGISIRWLNSTPKGDWTRKKNILLRAGFINAAFYSDAQSLRLIAQEEKLDALICVIAPNDDALIAYSAHLSIPVLLYQLDPYYNINDKETRWIKRQFLRVLPIFKHIFTTDLLLKVYQQDEKYQKIIKNFSVLPFPKLIQPKEDTITDSFPENITLLYTGSLYHIIRSPKLLLRLRILLPDRFEIRFCGSCDNDEEFEELKKSGIVCLGYCKQEIVAEEIRMADLLINIGNNTKNQMGSKIIDYISTGKPILNIVQFDDCPTIPLLHDYKYSFHLSAVNGIKISNELIEFIDHSRGKRMFWQDIVQKYQQYTPSYASEKILEKLN